MPNIRIEMEERKAKLLEVINAAINVCDPIPLKVFNVILHEKDGSCELIKVEKKIPLLV